jgi:hypothetical protein
MDDLGTIVKTILVFYFRVPFGNALISTRNRNELAATRLTSISVQSRFHAADILLLISLGLWALGVAQTQGTILGPYGLLTALPIAFYAGLVLIVISAGFELSRSHPSHWRMASHASALVIMLYGTAPLVYSQGRYAWLYKTIGVVQYVNAHGHLDANIDIYQNWPGFFALAAWFGKVAGVGSPLAYAKWAQLIFELAAIPLLYAIYDALSLSPRQRWVALLLYSASNWIGQDYFSPQAVATLLSLGIMAIMVRWLYLGSQLKISRPTQVVDATTTGRPNSWPSSSAVTRPVLLCSTVVLIYFVLTFTHELSPYIVAIQLGALAAARFLRPRWFPIVLLGTAIAYLTPRFAFVNSHYGLLNSIGSFFRNAAPPSSKVGTKVASSQLLIQRCAETLSLGMWGLAVAGAWLCRRAGRTVLALVLLAFSPFVLLGIQAYGDEGILRTYLFSLPWTAALAALALVPQSEKFSRYGLHRAKATSSGGQPRRLNYRKLCAPLALGVAITLFLPAFFGDDSFDAISKAEVATVTSFLENAPPGPIYRAIDNGPVADTSRYDQFPLQTIFGSSSRLGITSINANISDVIANDSLTYTHDRGPAYVLITPSMLAYSHAYGIVSFGKVKILLESLANSRTWKLIVDRAGTIIYELAASPSRTAAGRAQ